MTNTKHKNENAKNTDYIVPVDMPHVNPPYNGENSYDGTYDSSQGTKEKKPRKREETIKREEAKREKQYREHMPEKEIDKTVEDTFPASDPPGWY